MLVEDINKEESVSKVSLTSDFASEDMVNSKRSKGKGHTEEVGLFDLKKDDFGEYVDFGDQNHTSGPSITTRREYY